MPFLKYDQVTQDGDLVQLVGKRHKSHFLRLKAGAVFQTHRGELSHDELIGQGWGTLVTSHTGNPFYIMQPSLTDLIIDIKRNTQIIYPKDIGYIAMVMGIGPGVHVLEAGTGSGALTTAFAYLVSEHGHVTSYDNRAQMQNLARNNLLKVGLIGQVTLKLRDVIEGFDERDVDAIFLDLPNPYDYVRQAKTALKFGGYLGMILPTTNQVCRALEALRFNHFTFVEVSEVLLRHYKPDWERLRPTDRMVAHTGYLVFGRSVRELSDEN